MRRAAQIGVLVLIVPLVSVVAIVATSLLSSDSDGSNEAGGLVIAGFAYQPETLRVKAGKAIVVTNEDDAIHTVTADDGSFDSGDIEGGGRAEITVDGSGEISYFCQIHEYMRGTIEVDG